MKNGDPNMKNNFAPLFLGVLISGSFTFGLCAQQRSSSGARYAEELTAALSQQVRSVQDENARMELQIAELERKLLAVENENKELVETVRQLKRQAAAESAARDEQIRKLSDQIVKLASLPPPQPATPAASSSRKGAASAESGSSFTEYEEYEVVQGATLSAIAAAYKVSVADIKKANNLKSDILRVGQKLRIPVK